MTTNNKQCIAYLGVVVVILILTFFFMGMCGLVTVIISVLAGSAIVIPIIFIITWIFPDKY